ncbi:hypothetical protein NXW37_27970 [Bacteroides thetaiotaomicron]|nr:hypothetical protein [Bacteroides thetaiotaomicron]MCS2517439.1 hypothetical protein [Bacteroides thetaiotaomicron]MCS3371619.1 hypothetical protein [Bacteroides thetaiotaomicron]UVP82025.1 hypothetical protein NXX85_01980 [Bacteroides caccae]
MEQEGIPFLYPPNTYNVSPNSVADMLSNVQGREGKISHATPNSFMQSNENESTEESRPEELLPPMKMSLSGKDTVAP